MHKNVEKNDYGCAKCLHCVCATYLIFNLFKLLCINGLGGSVFLFWKVMLYLNGNLPF